MKIKPNLKNNSLTRKIFGLNQNLKKQKIDVIEEKPLTLYLNSQEIDFIFGHGLQLLFMVWRWLSFIVYVLARISIEA